MNKPLKQTSINVRFYPWDREVVEEAAALERLTLSEYMRHVALSAARRKIQRKAAEQQEAA